MTTSPDGPEPGPDGAPRYHKGELELFANYKENGPTDRVRALLVHSQLEGEGNLSKPIKAQAARLRAADDKGDDRDVIRGALNSVGRPGGLGEHIRCVVSVSMLTEGWDTRTVTHILGFRRFFHAASLRAGDRQRATTLQLRQLRQRRQAGSGVRRSDRRAV